MTLTRVRLVPSPFDSYTRRVGESHANPRARVNGASDTVAHFGGHGKMKKFYILGLLSLSAGLTQKLEGQIPSPLVSTQPGVRTGFETQAQPRSPALQQEPIPAAKSGNGFVRVVTWPARTCCSEKNGKRLLRAVTWPGRTYYRETRETFRDILHSKDSIYRVEAILLFAGTAFDVAATIDAVKRSPSVREANPLARALLGTRPRGVRPYIVAFAINTIQLDMAHYMQKNSDESSFYYNYAFGVTFVSALGHIVVGAKNLHAARCPPICASNQPTASRDLQQARTRIMSAVPAGPLHNGRTLDSLR